MSTVALLQTWQQQGEFISVNGHRIYSQVRGTGKPILILHGFPTSSFDYVNIAPLLENNYQLFLFDFLGYGFSDKPPNHPYSLFEQADIAEALAKHYDLSSVYILAHDMGDSVTLELFRRGNLNVEKVVMLNGSVLLDHYQALITQKLLLNSFTGPIISKLRLIRRPMFARQFGKVFAKRPSADEIDAFWQLVRHNDGMRNYHLLIQYLNERKIHEHTWLDALKAHTAPLTVIWGQCDPVAVPQIANAILERRPDTDYHPLDDIGHFPQWEAPDRVAGLIKLAFG